MKNCDFPYFFISLPEGSKNIHQLSHVSYPPARDGHMQNRWQREPQLGGPTKSPVAQHFDGYKPS